MYADIADKYLYSGEGHLVSEEAYLPFVKAVLDSKKWISYVSCVIPINMMF